MFNAFKNILKLKGEARVKNRLAAAGDFKAA